MVPSICLIGQESRDDNRTAHRFLEPRLSFQEKPLYGEFSGEFNREHNSDLFDFQMLYMFVVLSLFLGKDGRAVDKEFPSIVASLLDLF